ncbi:uncharacterized protein LOC119326224 [Triticum dicoccoides]|uniref:uncharacterized protein LOC119326224 n=1 Tax=Triticum dicoccoides TaxID=85692 RepID=UPI00188FD4CF|nr:uncharacterized protein LOC119326224 [Triticum dicoccoides]
MDRADACAGQSRRTRIYLSNPADAPGCGLASAGMVTKDMEKKLVGCGLMDREREGDGGLKMKGRLWPDHKSMATVQIPLYLSMGPWLFQSMATVQNQLSPWSKQMLGVTSNVAAEFAGGRSAEFARGTKTSVEPSNVARGGLQQSTMTILAEA